MKPIPTNQKLRGGYYTPAVLSEFLSNWAITEASSRVLEPSCGDGAILEMATQRFIQLGTDSESISSQLEGIELNKTEAKKARARVSSCDPGLECFKVHNGDFFTAAKKWLASEKRFDAVIGNPPFIRYQNFPEQYRSKALDIMRQAGLSPNRLTNTWVPFLITSSLLLNEHGRIGMIIPAELFQVNYAAESRQFLSDYFSKISIVTFNHLVFDDIQQEIVLFLGEKNGENKGITVTRLDDASDLDLFDYEASFKEDAKPMDHSKEKWTQYFLDIDEIELLRTLKSHPMIMKTGELFQVDVGVVTGENKYFVFNESAVKVNRLGGDTQRIVSRSNHLTGAIFTEKDWQHNVDLKRAAFLFAPNLNNGKRISKAASEYIRLGEELGVQKGYKCSIRKNWYVVPTLWVPDAFMLRQVHEYPMLILNQAQATSTDTIHRVRFENSDYDRDIITAAFMNTLTFAFAEVTGRSYGGGVLTFEPSEAENLPIPLEGANSLNLEELNKILINEGIEAVLDITDEILLIKGLGLSKADVAALRNIWEKLRDRRINRKRKKVIQDLVLA